MVEARKELHLHSERERVIEVTDSERATDWQRKTCKEREIIWETVTHLKRIIETDSGIETVRREEKKRGGEI